MPSVRLGVTDYAKCKAQWHSWRQQCRGEEIYRLRSEERIIRSFIEGWNEGWEDWFGHSKYDVFDFVSPYPDFDIKMLNDYAHSKGVKLMMHHETSSSALNYERHLEDAYTLMNKYGYDAVKSGYVVTSFLVASTIMDS